MRAAGAGCWSVAATTIGSRISVPEEAVARIGFGGDAPQHVEVAARRHPECWGVDGPIGFVRHPPNGHYACVRAWIGEVARCMNSTSLARAR
jgi:hypothetical protein